MELAGSTLTAEEKVMFSRTAVKTNKSGDSCATRNVTQAGKALVPSARRKPVPLVTLMLVSLAVGNPHHMDEAGVHGGEKRTTQNGACFGIEIAKRATTPLD